MDESEEKQEEGGSENSDSLPWIQRRDNAKSDRITKQLHIQQSTSQRESELLVNIENKFAENVYRADLREAALLVAMDHPDEIAEQLREWGYGEE